MYRRICIRLVPMHGVSVATRSESHLTATGHAGIAGSQHVVPSAIPRRPMDAVRDDESSCDGRTIAQLWATVRWRDWPAVRISGARSTLACQARAHVRHVRCVPRSEHLGSSSQPNQTCRPRWAALWCSVRCTCTRNSQTTHTQRTSTTAVPTHHTHTQRHNQVMSPCHAMVHGSKLTR